RPGPMDHAGLMADCLADVATAQADAGDRDGAERSRRRALQLLATPAKPFGASPRTVASTLARLGEFSRAIRVANAIQDPALRFLARAHIAIAQAKAKDRDAARRDLARVLNEVDHVRLTLFEKGRLCLDLAEALIGVGDIPGTLSAAESLKATGPTDH